MKFLQIVRPDTHFDFIGKFKIFLTLSILAAIAVGVGLFTKGLNYGIDFTGGTVMQVRFSEPTSAESARKLFDELGENDASVVALGEKQTEYLITTRTDPAGKGKTPLSQRLVDKLGAAKVTILSVDIVGPKVGNELKWAALRSLIYTILFVTIYIWLRFDFRFAPGATVAMIHDLTMATGYYLITGEEFTITAIAALLTIAGYSVNDTIVVYDRVREMLKKSGTAVPLPHVINEGINVTLSRTLLSSGLALISIIPIMFFTTGELRSFAIAMAFGIFVGTYSTVYIAAPFTIYVERYLEKRNPKDRSSRARVVTTP